MGKLSISSQRVQMVVCWIVLGVAWGFIFGSSAVASVSLFVNASSAAPGSVGSVTIEDEMATLRSRVLMIALGLVCVGAVRMYRRIYGAPPLPRRAGGALDAASAWAISMTFAFTVSSVLKLTSGALPWMDVSGSTSLNNAEHESPLLFVIRALLAGLVEEPLLAALPVLLLAGRVPIAWLIVLGGAMRGVLHLYYGGAGFAWAFVWGGAAVWLYYRYQRLWVLVLCHGFVLNIGTLGHLPNAPAWLGIAAVLFEVATIAVLSWYWLRRNPGWFRTTFTRESLHRLTARAFGSIQNSVR